MAYDTNGSSGTELQSVIQWSPQSYATTRIFHGTRTYCESIAASAQSLGLGYTLTPGDGPTARIEVVYTGSESSTDSALTTEWEFATRAAQVPIQEHPNYITDINNLISGESYAGTTLCQFLSTLKKLYDGVNPTTLDATYYDAITADTNTMVWVRKIMAGVDSYLRPEPVFSVQKRYDARASTSATGVIPDAATVGKYYTKSALVTALSIPTDVANKMPSGDWLCEDVNWAASSDGSRVQRQTFRFATDWDSDIYTAA